MTDGTKDEECLMERRECALTVQELAKAVVRQVTITEERVLPALEKVETALSSGSEKMAKHEIRLVKVEAKQASSVLWSKRGWGLFTAFTVGLVLAIVRLYTG